MVRFCQNAAPQSCIIIFHAKTFLAEVIKSFNDTHDLELKTL